MPELPTHAERAALVGRLRALADQLGGVDQATEQAFLLVGERVRSAQRQAAVLAGTAAEPTQAGDDSGEQAVARLQLLTERAALWLEEENADSTAICAVLQPLSDDVERLAGPLRRLAKLVKALQTLRVAIRIEATRVRGVGALVLGEELRSLGTLIQEKLQIIAARREVLAQLCRRAMDLESQARTSHLRDADSEIRQARQLLAQVAAQCVRATDQAGALGRRSTELAERFGEIVAALQFQDITRQRLQHISANVRDLAANLDVAAEAVPPVGELCLLQHEQLQRATDEFCSAVTRLDDNLRGMADGAGLLVEAARCALFADDGDPHDRIAPALLAVTACLEKIQTVNLAAGQGVFAVCQAVRDVAVLIAEVELLGEEMQLLAQNAAVSAAHGAGVGLTVIADSIHALAEDTGRQAEEMTGCCRRISAQAEVLDAGDRNQERRDAGLEGLLEDARSLTGGLREHRRGLEERIAAAGRQAAALSEGLATALDARDVRRGFLEKVDPALSELQALARDFGAAGRSQVGDGALLHRARSRYTMKSERDIHHNFLRQHAAEAVADDAAVVAAGAFGDNVELF